MAQPFSSATHPYRLNTPPSRGWGPSTTLVARGHRLRTRRVGAQQVTSSPEVPTEPESSPLRPGRHLRRTHRIPTRYLDSIYTETFASPTPEVSTTAPGQEHIENKTLSPDPFVVDAGAPVMDIHIGTGLFRTMSLREFPVATFKAPMPYDDFFNRKIQLTLSRRGLTLTDFLGMIGECEGCERIMWVRNKDYHRCQGKNARAMLAPARKLFSLLDSTAGGQGITKNQYEHLFASCVDCNLVFLRTAASQHSHSE